MVQDKGDYVIGPNGEHRPTDPVEQAFMVGRILTGEITEEDARREMEEERNHLGCGAEGSGVEPQRQG